MSKNNLNDIGERLNIIVKERLNDKWSELAKATGLSPSTLQPIKNGGDLRVNTLLRICDALNINSEWLLTGNGSMYRTETETKPAPVTYAKREEGLDDGSNTPYRISESVRHQKMDELMEGLSLNQQQEILLAVAEKKRLNALEKLVTDLSARGNPRHGRTEVSGELRQSA